MKMAGLLALVLAGCSATTDVGLRSRCQDAEVSYAPMQIIIEAAVTNPAIYSSKKVKLKEIDLRAMEAIRTCEAAADIGDIFTVKRSEATVYAAGQEAKTVSAGEAQ